jgi:anti-anti-sigma factor
MDQHIQLSESEEGTVVHLLDNHVLDDMHGDLLDVVELQDRSQVVLDLSAVRSISAAGLGRLLALKKKLHARGGDLALRNVGNQVQQAFVVTRLARYFRL